VPVSFAHDPAQIGLSFGRGSIERTSSGGDPAFQVTLYAPVSFELDLDGEHITVDAFDRLKYENTHHNWADRLEAKTDRLTITWRVQYIDQPTCCFVRVVRNTDGAELLPETRLTPE
jgi:hypothetical protein